MATKGTCYPIGFRAPHISTRSVPFFRFAFFSFLFAASPHLRSATAVERCEHDGEERAGGEGRRRGDRYIKHDVANASRLHRLDMRERLARWSRALHSTVQLSPRHPPLVIPAHPPLRHRHPHGAPILLPTPNRGGGGWVRFRARSPQKYNTGVSLPLLCPPFSLPPFCPPDLPHDHPTPQRRQRSTLLLSVTEHRDKEREEFV